MPTCVLCNKPSPDSAFGIFNGPPIVSVCDECGKVITGPNAVIIYCEHCKKLHVFTLTHPLSEPSVEGRSFVVPSCHVCERTPIGHEMKFLGQSLKDWRKNHYA